MERGFVTLRARAGPKLRTGTVTLRFPKQAGNLVSLRWLPVAKPTRRGGHLSSG